MSAHRYKQFRQKPVPQYRPADAVRHLGDLWRHSILNIEISTATTCALGDFTQDKTEFAIMKLCERGQMARCE